MNHQVNLLPADIRRRTIILSAARTWSLVLFVGCVTTGLLAICLLERLSGLESDRDQQAEDVAAVMAARQRRGELTDALNSKRSTLEEMRSLQTSEDPLRMVLSVSAAANNDPGSILIRSLEFRNETELPPNHSRATNGNQSEQSPASLTRMTLHALSRNDLAVARFVMQLRESGEFDSVALRSSLQTDPAKEPKLAREFVVEGRRVNLR